MELSQSTAGFSTTAIIISLATVPLLYFALATTFSSANLNQARIEGRYNAMYLQNDLSRLLNEPQACTVSLASIKLSQIDDMGETVGLPAIKDINGQNVYVAGGTYYGISLQTIRLANFENTGVDALGRNMGRADLQFLISNQRSRMSIRPRAIRINLTFKRGLSNGGPDANADHDKIHECSFGNKKAEFECAIGRAEFSSTGTVASVALVAQFTSSPISFSDVAYARPWDGTAGGTFGAFCNGEWMATGCTRGTIASDSAGLFDIRKETNGCTIDSDDLSKQPYVEVTCCRVN